MEARTVLGGAGLSGALQRTGLRAEDSAAVEAVARRVVERTDSLAEVDRLAARLRDGIGVFPGEPQPPAWPGYQPGADPFGIGVLPLLACLVTEADLVEFHRSRDVPGAVTAATLRELGQQVLVHRLTFGTFGLHTYGWLPVTWSGSLYWLGRLQFNLELLPREEVQQQGPSGGDWVCSTHIPRSGRLDPAAVDDSFARAAAFFPRHFPDRPVSDYWCSSWLLDPELAAALDPGSNMTRFQRRWHLYGEPMPGDEDALFFTFAHRGEVDLEALPRTTTLQRALVDRLRSGRHWSVRKGRIPMAGAVGAPGGAPA